MLTYVLSSKEIFRTICTAKLHVAVVKKYKEKKLHVH